MNFKVGDKVIALTDAPSEKSQPRKAGQEYTVQAILYCSGCGIQCINVGPPSNGKHIICAKCGKKSTCDGLAFTMSQLFTKPSIYKLEVSIPELLTINQPQYQ